MRFSLLIDSAERFDRPHPRAPKQTASRVVIRRGWSVLFITHFVLNTATAQVTFIDATASSGLNFMQHVPLPPASPVGPSMWAGSGAGVADYDLDGDLDVYLVDSFGWPNKFFRNNGDKTFTDVTDETPLGNTGSGRMALFVDLDNDGDPDLVVGNETQGYAGLTPPQLFRNDSGTWVNVSTDSGFSPNGVIFGGMAASDYDQDGLLDLYVTYWDVANDSTPFNYLFRNRGDFAFEDVTAAVGLRTTVTQVQAWSPVFADLDKDGDQDLFTAVDFDLNYYFRLETLTPTGPHFIDDSLIVRPFHCCSDASGNDMGVAVGDIDGDDDLDLFTTNITLPPPNEQLRTNAMLINHGVPAAFTDEAVARGVWQSYWGWGTAFFDVDLDGDLDAYSVNGRGAGDGSYWSDRPAQLFLNDGFAAQVAANPGAGIVTRPDGSGYFSEIAAAAGVDHRGNSRGFVPFDYDLDGDIDLLVVNVAQPAVLFENRTTAANRWLAIRLAATTGNRDAVGAKVRVRTGERRQLREVITGGSLYASLPLTVHYGVGAATVVDSVVIDWPAGAQTTWFNVPTNQNIVITEGDAPPAAQAVGLSILGGDQLRSGELLTLQAVVDYHYALPADVTSTAGWSVEPAGVASISANGVLSAAFVEEDQVLQVTAGFGGRSAVKLITLLSTDAPLEQPPVVEITSPTSMESLSTSAPLIDLRGEVASEEQIAAMTWSISGTPLDGACTLTDTAWHCSGVALEVGTQLIEVRATSDSGLIGLDQLTVTRVPESIDQLRVEPNRLELGLSTLLGTFSVSYNGGATIDYVAETDIEWLSVVPRAGQVSAGGPARIHTVEIDELATAGATEVQAVITLTPASPTTAATSIVVIVLPTVDAPPPLPLPTDDPPPGNDNIPDTPDDANENDNVAGHDEMHDPDQPSNPRVTACGPLGCVWLLAVSLLALRLMLQSGRKAQGSEL